jgi:hypothetical protein
MQKRNMPPASYSTTKRAHLRSGIESAKWIVPGIKTTLGPDLADDREDTERLLEICKKLRIEPSEILDRFIKKPINFPVPEARQEIWKRQIDTVRHSPCADRYLDDW